MPLMVRQDIWLLSRLCQPGIRNRRGSQLSGSGRASSGDRHTFEQLLGPIEDDVDLRAGEFTDVGLICRKDHDKSLAVRGDVVVPVKTDDDESFDWQCLLIAERKLRLRYDID